MLPVAHRANNCLVFPKRLDFEGKKIMVPLAARLRKKGKINTEKLYTPFNEINRCSVFYFKTLLLSEHIPSRSKHLVFLLRQG